VDWDGQIRMDPSSPYAMGSLIALKDRFDIYGESFNGPDHLRRILEDAQSIVDDALAGDPPLRDAGRAAPERTRGA
jgi:phosphoglucomutase